MADLQDGESVEVRGSSSTYTLRNVGGVYSCSCPAWRNQNTPHYQRTCKHLRAFRGVQEEDERLKEAGAPERARAVSQARPVNPDAPPLLLAHSWDNVQDLTGWWMSEKLDGVRAWWDGKRLQSRQGNPFHAPDWFLEWLPPIPLDGELWAGRRRFQRAVSIVRRQDRSKDWEEIRFLVFDAPSAPGGFEERLDYCRSVVQAGPAAVHEHSLCKGVEHLRSELARVEAEGGEGLMLRAPGSLYEAGRSWTLLKVKTFRDAEARVVGYEKGAGKHEGRVGALVLELEDGTRFSAGTGLSDRERENPPPLGSLVTFRYQELSDAGVPRFPSYVRQRTDLDAPAEAPVRPAPQRTQPMVPAAEPPPRAASPSEGGGRRFEFVEGGSAKFWEIELQGASHTVRFGRLGTAGQSKTKEFASPEAAARDAEKLVAEKTGKGYREV